MYLWANEPMEDKKVFYYCISGIKFQLENWDRQSENQKVNDYTMHVVESKKSLVNNLF